MSLKLLIRQVAPSLIFVALIIFVKILEEYFQLSLEKYGVFPRSIEGILGIITSPSIHGDWKHVFNNSVPLMVLGTSLRYFYKDISKEVFFGLGSSAGCGCGQLVGRAFILEQAVLSMH